MPQGRSGVNANTPDKLILDAGEVWANIDLTALEGSSSDPVAAALADAVALGATRGGNSFSPGRTLREMPVDGTLGTIKGFVRRQTVAPTLTINQLEMTVENFTRAFAGAESETTGDFTKITGAEILDASYFNNIALLTTYTGNPDTPIVVVIENCLPREAPELSFTDEDEVVMSVSFVGHFDPANPLVEPWAIYHPGDVPSSGS